MVKTLVLSLAGLRSVPGIHSWKERTDFPRVESSPPLALTIFLPPLPHTSLSPRVLGRSVQLCTPQRPAAFTRVLQEAKEQDFPWEGLYFRKMGYSTQHARYCLCQGRLMSFFFHNHQQVSAECVVEGWLRSRHNKRVGTG